MRNGENFGVSYEYAEVVLQARPLYQTDNMKEEDDDGEN